MISVSMCYNLTYLSVCICEHISEAGIELVDIVSRLWISLSVTLEIKTLFDDYHCDSRKQNILCNYDFCF